MIRYGPAGIPLSCKGRTFKDGIEDVHNLALTAMEIQLVRPRTFVRPPDEEYEVGKSMLELDQDSGFVVGIMREGDVVFDPEAIVSINDSLIEMNSGANARFSDLPRLGEVAKNHDVQLSVHAPFYMDLGADPANEEDPCASLAMQCLDTVRFAGSVCNALDGNIVVTNLGPYDRERSDLDTEANIEANLRFLAGWWKDADLKPRLGIEVTGNQDVWGSLEQVLDICDTVDGLTPVMNFAHHHARTCGSLITVEDFMDVLDQVGPYSGDMIYSAFASVEYDADGNERWLTPIKKGDLKFERLAEALSDLRTNITIISTSPLLEHDAVYMRTLTERVLSKRAAKFLKERRKAEAAAEAAATKAATSKSAQGGEKEEER